MESRFWSKSGGPPERFHGDVVFLDLLRRAFEILLADVRQQLRQIRSAIENAGCQYGFQFMSFLPKIGGRVHS